MTLYSFSRRSCFKDCRAEYRKRYIEKDRGPQTDAMLIGIEADNLIEPLVAAVLDGTVKKGSEIVDFLKGQITDVEDADGVVTSIQTSASWVIERGLDQLAAVLKELPKAEVVETQEMLYFDADWNLLEQEPGEGHWGLKRRATWGGDLDIAWYTGAESYVRDWKTGSSRWSKPQQVVEYQALQHLAYEGIEVAHGGLVWLKENKLERVASLKPGGVQAVLDNMQTEAAAIEEAVQSGDFECRRVAFCSKGCRV